MSRKYYAPWHFASRTRAANPRVAAIKLDGGYTRYLIATGRDYFVASEPEPGMKISGGKHPAVLYRSEMDYDARPSYGSGEIHLAHSHLLAAWVLAEGPAWEPEGWAGDGSEPYGDGWYQCRRLPEVGESVTMTASGAYAGTGDATLQIWWPRRERASVASVWSPVGLYDVGLDGAETYDIGVEQLGAELYRDDAGADYIETVDYATRKLVGYRGASGLIYDDGSGWIIGVRGVDVWYEGEQPSVTAPVTFRAYAAGEDGAKVPAPGKTDIVVTYDSLVSATTTGVGYVTEVATWRP